MRVTVSKCLHGAAPSILRTYLQVREAGSYFLRGYAKLSRPLLRQQHLVFTLSGISP